MALSPLPKSTAPNPNERHPDRLPRLHPSAYQSNAAVLWTHTTQNRATGWLTGNLHQTFRELTLHMCARENLLVPAYVLMPDHIHMVIIGLEKVSDQRNGIAFLRRHVEPKLRPVRFQRQAHDHVLTSDERKQNAFARTCQYVLLNPVRAGLAANPAAYQFRGCIIPGYPDLNRQTTLIGGCFGKFTRPSATQTVANIKSSLEWQPTNDSLPRRLQKSPGPPLRRS